MSIVTNDYIAYLLVFVVIGFGTFFLRAVFLYSLPQVIKNNQTIRQGLNSVPSALLVALVVPYTFFINGSLVLWRNDVIAILLTIPVIWFTKKPGLSLPIALLILIFLNTIFI